MNQEISNKNHFKVRGENPSGSTPCETTVPAPSSETAELNRAIAYLREQVRPFIYNYLLNLKDLQRTEGAIPARRLDEHHAKPLGFLFSRICSKQDVPILEYKDISGGRLYKLTELGVRAIEKLEVEKA